MNAWWVGYTEDVKTPSAMQLAMRGVVTGSVVIQAIGLNVPLSLSLSHPFYGLSPTLRAGMICLKPRFKTRDLTTIVCKYQNYQNNKWDDIQPRTLARWPNSIPNQGSVAYR